MKKKAYMTSQLAECYEARTHQVDGVSAYSTQVGHRRALDTSTMCV